MTLHCGLTRRGAEWAARGERALGIVSRGGSILARWMLKNDKENPLLTGYDRLLELARKYNVTLSLGDVSLSGMTLAAIVAMIMSLVFHALDRAKLTNDV